MEVISPTGYIKSLNRNSLIEFLSEQKFKTESKILNSKDIDGEKFLNFTELDLVQWRLTTNQKKALLNCRNQLLARPLQSLLPKFMVPEMNSVGSKKEQIKQKVSRTLEASRNNKANSIRPLPALPNEDNTYSNKINSTQNYKEPKTVMSHRSLLDTPKEIDYNSEDNYEEPRNVGSQRSLPTLPKDDDYQLDEGDYEEPKKIGSLRPLSTLPKKIDSQPNLFGGQKISSVLPNESSRRSDESIVGDFDEPKRFGTQRPLPPLPKEPENIVKDHKKTQITGIQRPLPAIPNKTDQHLDFNIEEHYDVPKSFIRQSIRYVDMTQAKSASLENLGDYVDMNAQPKIVEDYINTSSITSKITPQIPEKPKLNSLSHQNELRSKESTPKNAMALRKPNLKSEVTFKAQEVENNEDYSEPNAIIASTKEPLNYNMHSSLRTSTEVHNHPPSIRNRDTSTSKISERSLSFGQKMLPKSRNETEPVFESKPPRGNSTKIRIQDLPLPPIPPANVFNVATSEKSSASNPFLLSTDKPKLLPKPAINKELESNVNFDIENLPPPPPEFWDFSDIDAAPKQKEESQLPRPPHFNNLYEQEHVRILQELVQDDSSSSDEEQFNPNNYTCYRNTDRKGAKQLLRRVENLEDDTFLLRPSTNDSYFLGLTIYHDKYFYNLGVYRDLNGKFFCESFHESGIVKFCTLNDFVYHYKYNPLVIKKKDGDIIELYLKYALPKEVF